MTLRFINGRLSLGSFNFSLRLDNWFSINFRLSQYRLDSNYSFRKSRNFRFRLSVNLGSCLNLNLNESLLLKVFRCNMLLLWCRHAFFLHSDRCLSSMSFVSIFHYLLKNFIASVSMSASRVAVIVTLVLSMRVIMLLTVVQSPGSTFCYSLLLIINHLRDSFCFHAHQLSKYISSTHHFCILFVLKTFDLGS
jgi:hypothetical protein